MEGPETITEREALDVESQEFAENGNDDEETLLTPSGVGDEAFTQIPNRDLFAIIREYIRPTSQGEFRILFMQDLSFFVKDYFELTNSTYREWVAMVQIYFSEVLLRYDFLTEGLDPTH